MSQVNNVRMNQINPLSNTSKERGIGLLELMLSLSIIAILLVMATRYYATTKASQQLNDGLSMATGIISAGAKYYISNSNNYTNISLDALSKAGYIPASFCGNAGKSNACSGANPWGGGIKVDGSSGNYYTIVMDSLPANLCTGLAGMINSAITNTNASANNSSAKCSGDNAVLITIY